MNHFYSEDEMFIGRAISASPYRDDVMDRQWSTGLGDRMLLVDCVIFHRKDLFFFFNHFYHSRHVFSVYCHFGDIIDLKSETCLRVDAQMTISPPRDGQGQLGEKIFHPAAQSLR